jgi:S-adenosyl methyltransferase
LLVTRPDWAPPDVDIERPSVARIYDYNLGGSHNFTIDRAAAEQINQAMPGLRAANRANRAFLRRAVRYLTAAGIRQFLDLGSGIPTVGNVHEVARQSAPDARVVYVDIDPVAVAHGRAILGTDPRCGVLLADLRDPRRVLDDPIVTGLLDLRQPVAVLIVAVLHFVSDAADPAGIVATFRDAIVPGSYIAISHATMEEDTAEEAEAVRRASARNTIDLTLRGRAEVSRFFEGLRLVAPGMVYTPQWRPDTVDDELSSQPSRSATLAAVGIKP